jgi:hypothetical protein
VQRKLDEMVADHEEVVRGLQRQLRLLRAGAAEVAVCFSTATLCNAGFLQAPLYMSMP